MKKSARSAGAIIAAYGPSSLSEVPLVDIVVLGLDLVVVGLGWARLRKKPEDWLVLGLIVGLSCAVVGAVLGWPFRFHAFRLWCWGLFLACPLYAVGAAGVLGRRHPVGAVVQAVAGLVLFAAGLDAFFVEPQDLQLTRYTLVSDEVTEPVRIGLIADLQTEDPGPYEREAVRRLLEQQPDVILWAGDYVQHRDPAEREAAIRVLNGLLRELAPAPPLGMVAVPGNCEFYDRWPEVFDGLPAQASEATTPHALGPLTVTALSFRDGFDTELEVEAVPGFHVVLAHGPDFALGEIDADLLLAGHTHGGQVRIPLLDWPPITYSRVPRAWAAGRTELPSGATLIVSRGVGMERDGAPPLRLGCRPELVVIDVVPAG